MKLDVNKYTYRTEWSEDDNAFICRCLEFPSLAAHGDTPEEALEELKDAVETAIEWLIEDNEAVPEPYGLRKYKGNITLRVSPQTHRLLAIQAAEEGVSINQYITDLIESNHGYNRFEENYRKLQKIVNKLEEQISYTQTLIESRKYPVGFEGTGWTRYQTSERDYQRVWLGTAATAFARTATQKEINFTTEVDWNFFEKVSQDTRCNE